MAAAGSLKKMLSHSAVYGVGTVLAKATSVIMLPIYTRYLTPADYGLLELLSLLTDLTALLFGMRIFTGVYRYYFEHGRRRTQERGDLDGVDRERRDARSSACSSWSAFRTRPPSW